jgi:hypothetical protein
MCLLCLACIMAAFLLLGYIVLRRSLPHYMNVTDTEETELSTTTAETAPAKAVAPSAFATVS